MKEHERGFITHMLESKREEVGCTHGVDCYDCIRNDGYCDDINELVYNLVDDNGILPKEYDFESGDTGSLGAERTS